MGKPRWPVPGQRAGREHVTKNYGEGNRIFRAIASATTPWEVEKIVRQAEASLEGASASTRRKWRNAAQAKKTALGGEL